MLLIEQILEMHAHSNAVPEVIRNVCFSLLRELRNNAPSDNTNGNSPLSLEQIPIAFHFPIRELHCAILALVSSQKPRANMFDRYSSVAESYMRFALACVA